MDRGRRLKKIMKERGYNVSQLSKDSGIPYTTIDSMIKRNLKGASIDNVLKLSKVLKVSAVSLIEEFPPNIYEVDGKIVKIPLIGEIACGDPITANQNVIEYIDEPSDFLPQGNLFYLKAKGSSMYPTIPDGSLVLIREQPDVDNNEIGAVLLNDSTEASLKRVKKQGDSVILVSDNPEYMPIVVDKENPAKIIGKAVSIRRELWSME